MSTITTFRHDELTIDVYSSPQRVVMKWRGSSDARDPSEFLSPVFQRFIGGLGERSVTIDFTDLEFMNSSTVSPIIGLLRDLDRLAVQARVVFSDVDWQQVHLRCMRTISRVLKHIQIEGGSRDSSVPALV